MFFSAIILSWGTVICKTKKVFQERKKEPERINGSSDRAIHPRSNDLEPFHLLRQNLLARCRPWHQGRSESGLQLWVETDSLV